MTGRERLRAALRGEPVDRPPLWLREGFDLLDPIPPADDFHNGWKDDPRYRDLFAFLQPHADVIHRWHNGLDSRFLAIPGHRFVRRTEEVDANTRRSVGTVRTSRGELRHVDEVRRGYATNWHIEPLVKDVDDLRALAELPFELPAEAVPRALERYRKALAQVGERGILRTDFPSPIVAISGCMDFQLFLELSILEKELFHRLLAEITRRLELVIDAVFGGPERLDTIVNFGGSEQCTPPMMAPEAFDEYVVPYDGRLVRKLHGYGVLCSCHCHSSVRHALQGMVAAGYDSTDPVEPPPQGDVTWAEAKAIVDGRLTLFGNLEWTELEAAEPAHIQARVQEILAAGPCRTVVAASAGPMSRITPRLDSNYRALVEALLAGTEA